MVFNGVIKVQTGKRMSDNLPLSTIFLKFINNYSF